MKKFFVFTAALIVMFFISNTTSAQFRMSVGPTTGMNFNIHTGSDVDESGNGFGILFGAHVDMTFTQDKSIGLITGLTFYDNRSGSTDVTGSEQGINYTVENNVSISYFEIESLFKFRLPSGLYFVFGPELGFDLSAELESTTRITTPGYTFQNGSTSQKSKASLKDTNARFELKTGVGYDIDISPLITLTPQLTFGFGLSDVIEDVDYSIHTFQLQCICKFNLIK